MAIFLPQGLGWHRDIPDPRDYTPENDDVVRLLHGLETKSPLPQRIDWREYFAGIEDQGKLAASPAHACVGLVAYFERRASGKIIEPSRMFVYQTSQRLLNWTGDSGATLRATCKAISRFGAPCERYRPYDPAEFRQQPDAFAYAAAGQLSSVGYVRLDLRGEPGAATLERVKSFLAAGFPSIFGFPVCTSVSTEADIPFPTVFDAIRGGQAVIAAGYDDQRRVRSDKGALLVANSWGTRWGDRGYGWLPYSYVREGLAADFWTLLKPDWLSSGEFSRPV